MAGTVTIVRAFRAQREAIQSVRGANGVKPVFASGEQFVNVNLMAHIPDKFQSGLSGWGWAYCRDGGARSPHDIGHRDSRVGLWRPAVYGTGPTAAPLVAALVAAPALRHGATGVVHRPQQVVALHASCITREAMMQRTIIGFHQDAAQEWVADLACGQ